MATGLSAFYLPLGESEFESTAATESPWDPAMQHGGPPAALLARAVERARPDAGMSIVRFTVDMLGPIEQGRIRTEASVVRPGKRIELVEARLWANDRLAVTATAWRLRTHPGSTADYQHESALPSIPAGQPQQFFVGLDPNWGYGRAIDWRFVDGGFDQPGPVKVWARVRIPLVAGESSSPVARLLIVADSTNGLSGVLPLAGWLFIPPTMTATIVRPPASEWMLLDARTSISPDGIGLAEGHMYDQHGLTAAIAQPLLVVPRG